MPTGNNSSDLMISTKLIYDELKRRNAHPQIIDAQASLLEYADSAGMLHYISSTCSDKSSATGFLIARDKSRTATIADQLTIPIPVSKLCDTFEEALIFLKTYQKIVLKPVSNKGGVGVSTDITTKTALKRAYSYAHAQGSRVIAQQHLIGDDVRLLVVGDKFVSAVTRQPAHITANGTDTIAALIASENKSQSRNDTSMSSLMHIDTYAAKRFLGQHIESVPPHGKSVQVVGPANVSLGGSLHEASHLVPESMKQDAIKITQKLGLGICGVDMIWNQDSNSYGLIEVNAVPGIDIHDDPFSKTSAHVAQKYVNWLLTPISHSVV